jgi:hypothetical protein
MGGSVAGRMRWEREGRTNSLKRTCVAPESARMGEGRSDRAQQGRVKRVFIVGIVRFQSDEGVEVGETRDWFEVYSGGKKRKIGMREGGGCIERSKGVYKNSGGWCGGGVFLVFLSVAFLV